MSDLYGACLDAYEALGEFFGSVDTLIHYPDAYAQRPDGWDGWDDVVLANVTGNPSWRGLKTRMEEALREAAPNVQ